MSNFVRFEFTSMSEAVTLRDTIHVVCLIKHILLWWYGDIWTMHESASFFVVLHMYLLTKLIHHFVIVTWIRIWQFALNRTQRPELEQGQFVTHEWPSCQGNFYTDSASTVSERNNRAAWIAVRQASHNGFEWAPFLVVSTFEMRLLRK